MMLSYLLLGFLHQKHQLYLVYVEKTFCAEEPLKYTHPSGPTRAKFARRYIFGEFERRKVQRKKEIEIKKNNPREREGFSFQKREKLRIAALSFVHWQKKSGSLSSAWLEVPARGFCLFASQSTPFALANRECVLLLLF